MSKSKFIKMLAICMALCTTGYAAADELDDAVIAVSQSKTTEMREIYQTTFLVVYVGRDGDCDAVSAQQGQHIQNFRVCNGVSIPRNTVSPSWPAQDGRQTFLDVVNNAIANGRSQQTDQDGYLIAANVLFNNGRGCNNVEVVISYNLDLVDREIITPYAR